MAERTALHDRLTAADARYEERDGFAVARDFGSRAREVAAVRTTVGIADRGARGFTLFEGSDAAKFLQGMVSNDVESVAVGSATYALLLTPKARVVADLRLTRLAESTFLADSEPAATPALRQVLTRYRLRSRVTIEPAEARYGAIAVAGRRSGLLLTDAFGILPRADAAEGEGFAVPVGDRTLAAVASACCGEKAFELIGARAEIGAAWDALAANLHRHAGAVIGADALETLRIEAGIPRFGRELDEVVMPSEVGVVERAVSFTKGCYIGQEPVARLHYRGHANRGLRTILLDHAAPIVGATVSLDGRDVGRVTSATESPTLGRPIALAIVRREVATGERVTVSWDDRAAEGEVMDVPAYGWSR